ncbi:Gfo/Idh/MocA family protein [Halopelagius longus]|uniref:Gfo/Idh/MocA family oxidoreductase n=1 Tax=Halopelagius longus TaxID=1236180 RepID=A0A1H1FSE5_9EURY|nr:Gfo/Idh/MocA family oxidoreductase [Halopelagius longus]RDI70190.1 gfo/Idh/MocA family oxidoreductase [Halopelagius longus]SDR03698.1 Predicted dehydrogenase [Halopelagius longus]
MSEFSIGFVGAGTIADWHAQRISRLGGEISAVADVDPTARRRFADEHGVKSTFKRYEEMLSTLQLDVVVVAVPNAFHADCAVAALESGANVFVEKPLADSVAGARRVADAERENEGTVMVGFMKAFEPNTDLLFDHVRGREFGDVYEVNVEYVRRRGIPQLGSWFTQKDIAGGGVVVDIGPHMLHLALSVLDFPDIESVSATTGSHFGVKAQEYTYLEMWGGDPVEDGTFDVEDHVRALVRTADGSAIHLNCAWASNTEPVQHVQVRGDEGGATLTPGDDGLTVHTTREDSLADHTFETPDGDPYEAEWEYFFEVLRGERVHDRNTVSEGVTVQRLIDAIYRSAEDGGEVVFDAADSDAEAAVQSDADD